MPASTDHYFVSSTPVTIRTERPFCSWTFWTPPWCSTVSTDGPSLPVPSITSASFFSSTGVPSLSPTSSPYSVSPFTTSAAPSTTRSSEIPAPITSNGPSLSPPTSNTAPTSSLPIQSTRALPSPTRMTSEVTLSTAAFAGIIVGVFVASMVLTSLIFICCTRRRSASSSKHGADDAVDDNRLTHVNSAGLGMQMESRIRDSMSSHSHHSSHRPSPIFIAPSRPSKAGTDSTISPGSHKIDLRLSHVLESSGRHEEEEILSDGRPVAALYRNSSLPEPRTASIDHQRRSTGHSIRSDRTVQAGPRVSVDLQFEPLSTPFTTTAFERASFGDGTANRDSFATLQTIEIARTSQAPPIEYGLPASFDATAPAATLELGDVTNRSVSSLLPAPRRSRAVISAHFEVDALPPAIHASVTSSMTSSAATSPSFDSADAAEHPPSVHILAYPTSPVSPNYGEGRTILTSTDWAAPPLGRPMTVSSADGSPERENTARAQPPTTAVPIHHPQPMRPIIVSPSLSAFGPDSPAAAQPMHVTYDEEAPAVRPDTQAAARIAPSHLRSAWSSATSLSHNSTSSTASPHSSSSPHSHSSRASSRARRRRRVRSVLSAPVSANVADETETQDPQAPDARRLTITSRTLPSRHPRSPRPAVRRRISASVESSPRVVDTRASAGAPGRMERLQMESFHAHLAPRRSQAGDNSARTKRGRKPPPPSTVAATDGFRTPYVDSAGVSTAENTPLAFDAPAGASDPPAIAEASSTAARPPRPARRETQSRIAYPAPPVSKLGPAPAATSTSTLSSTHSTTTGASSHSSTRELRADLASATAWARAYDATSGAGEGA